jgi:hypothetical protein
MMASMRFNQRFLKIKNGWMARGEDEVQGLAGARKELRARFE